MNTEHHVVWLTVNRAWSHSSLALPLLHAAAKDIPGWHWRRVESVIEDDPARIAAEIVGQPCDLLCATLYLFNRQEVLDILQRVHALSPEIHIAVGGPECSGCSTFLQNAPFISTLFCGEGEELFPEFLRNFPEKRNRRQRIPEVGNAVYTEWITSPFPSDDPFFRLDKPFVQIETSRGCPMSCAYCTSSGVKVRYRELDQVKAELELLSSKGVKEIRVLDRTFNLPQERGSRLLALFREFPDIHFHLEVHPQFLGNELRQQFTESLPGQLHIEAGIQSLDAAVQSAIGRRSDMDQALDGLRFLTSCPQFETHTDLLSGLPAQTIQSLCRDITTLIQCHPAEIQLEVLKILPGTPILKTAEKYGLVWSPKPPYDVMRTSTMTMEEILYTRTLSRLLDLFYNHAVLHPVILELSEKDPDVFLKLAEFLCGRDLNTLLDLKKRFLVLKEFLGSSSEEWDLQWLQCGYPPEETAAEWIHEIPADANYISGEPASLTHYGSKFLRLKHGDEMVYLVMNRTFRCGKPCGLWKKSLRHS